tara:strand:+ start:449 stop:814 length:366 start_codon:yes stop_codon:yes gene_type:complete
MRVTSKQLRRIIQEELFREQDERVVFDPEKVDLPIPKTLARLLDPDLTPAKFAQFDAELDASGKPDHQAFALAAFAMTYADNDAKGAGTILMKAKGLVPKIVKAMEQPAPAEGEAKEETQT